MPLRLLFFTELLTFIAFIADHNSAFVNFLCSECFITSRHFGRSLQTHKRASGESDQLNLHVSLIFSDLSDRKIVKECIKFSHVLDADLYHLNSVTLSKCYFCYYFVLFSSTKFQISSKLSTKNINMLYLYTHGQFTVGGLGYGLNQGPRTAFKNDFECE